jgi:hypothetical protein
VITFYERKEDSIAINPAEDRTFPLNLTMWMQAWIRSVQSKLRRIKVGEVR